MMFRVLGPLEVTVQGTIETPTATKVRWTLALLLLRANQVVSRASIIAELWGEHPPRSAVTTAQTYVYQIRKKYQHRFSQLGWGEFVQTRSPGYLLRVDEAEIDAWVFERLSEQGRTSLESGHVEQAARQLHGALALWRGPALADVPAGPLLTPHVTHLAEIRTRTLRLRIVADRRLGRHHELIPELQFLAAANPIDEWFHQQLMIALTETGRRADALQVYERLQSTLGAELGVAPSSRLCQLQHDVVAGVPWTLDPQAELDLVVPRQRTGPS
ncbi:DNA-binding transcriptional activator of the SARP family [Micromonospora matsumotoense]|uniref:DNA-binding transcriptional activator of the SARP family n=1 Tax=Micromonospora matsumotoense TaxID=121616 RepID=A0A1C5A278_9ACTN|nr:AfsR/SARP family transcriptional regulator [Micromonospora matsumotoense]SCF39249.1 DNA-binding transcriptional activator of the SARP family [Micromonospora matsumotoense]